MFIIYSLVIFDSRLPFFFESIACYLLVSFCTFKFDNSDFSNWVIFIYLHIFFIFDNSKLDYYFIKVLK